MSIRCRHWYFEESLCHIELESQVPFLVFPSRSPDIRCQAAQAPSETLDGSSSIRNGQAQASVGKGPEQNMCDPLGAQSRLLTRSQ